MCLVGGFAFFPKFVELFIILIGFPIYAKDLSKIGFQNASAKQTKESRLPCYEYNLTPWCIGLQPVFKANADAGAKYTW